MVYTLKGVTVAKKYIKVIYDISDDDCPYRTRVQNEPVACWICARDVSLALNYNKSNIPLYNIDKEYKATLESLIPGLHYELARLIFINKQGLEQLLARSTKPKALIVGQEIAALMGASLNVLVPQKAQNHFAAIMTVFAGENIVEEYCVRTPELDGHESYRIDLYFVDHKIAVECDEFGHTGYDPEKEKRREDFIKAKLGCRFYRFNPDKPNFNIYEVIGEIRRMIMYVEQVSPNELANVMGGLSINCGTPSTSMASQMGAQGHGCNQAYRHF